MKRTPLILFAISALVAADAALAATRTVLIRAGGFDPASVTIRAGDTVVWRNVDTRLRQVVSNTGTFASPMLARNQTYSFTFQRTGTFRYHDALVANRRGTVIVRTRPAPAAGVTMTTSVPSVVFGASVTLAGTVSSRRPNETVTIYARPHGQLSYVEVASVLTSQGGFWAYVAKPTVLTAYQVRFRSATSSEQLVQVRPKITLLPSGRSSFVARVTGARSFAGRYLVLQRLSSDGRWLSVTRYKLGARSGRIFRRPRVIGTYRVYLTTLQAGEGYAASWSGTQRIRRR